MAIVDVKINSKLKRLVQSHKPIKAAIGGRGSGKSIGFGDIFTIKMDTEKSDIYCLREYQDSLADSVHRVFRASINERMHLTGWDIQSNTIIAPNGACTKYVGAARNPSSIQSAQDYKYSWFEEAQKASQESIDLLLPTILRNHGSECWFSLNPCSVADPISQRLIAPFLDQLMTRGYYEDKVHLIAWVNWRDNPWWNESQELIRQWDFDHLTRAKYDWIWEGAFNDSVEDALILSEWFDACIDAHKRLGFRPQGIRFASHDPSDTGPDSKGFALRHGSVLIDLQEMTTGDINTGGDWATGLAIRHGVDAFTWDCDGMGVGLNRQVTAEFSGKSTIISMFRGSEGVDNPDAVFEPADKQPVRDQKTNADALKNKRSQYYHQLRGRIYRTYRAVVFNEYHDPDTLISFSSDIAILPKLRSELCRMPVKPNGSGKFELYDKPTMKTKFKMSSPNLGDSVMMLMRTPHQIMTAATAKPPPVIRPQGVRTAGHGGGRGAIRTMGVR